MTMVQAGETFRTPEPPLHKVLSQIHEGVMQLPDFQRGWVWDDEHIRALLASVSLSYPIGAVMLLETGGEGARFKPRLVEGVELRDPPEPSLLILDGQQRLTSLYLAMRSGCPVPTRTEKGQDIDRVYYLDMKACLDPEGDRIDAIRSLAPDRMIKTDFGRKIELDVSTPEKEYEHGYFPFEHVFDTAAVTTWGNSFQSYHGHAAEQTRFWGEFQMTVWLPFQQYKVPVIELLKNTPKVAVCQVFEKVNTGGVTLSVFELVTATFAAEEFQLRKDWEAREERLHEHDVLQDVDATAFLTSVTLRSTYERHCEGKGAVSCKRKDVLRLTLDDYRRYADDIEEGLVKVARLLAREKVFDTKTLPYTTQLIPLSAICAVLGDQFEQEPVKNKLARWFWCGVLGELYGGANESRYAFDLPEVIRWVDGGDEPRTVREANFSPMRLISLQTRLSAAYKGLVALLMQRGSCDFLSGDTLELNTYFDLAVDIHHIFPRDYCQKNDLPRSLWNSIINKAPLSAKTNRMIGGKAPSAYLSSLETRHKLDPERLNEILQSHCVNPLPLRADAFELFIRARAIELLDLIEKATGRPVAGRDSEEVVEAFGGALLPPRPDTEAVA